MAEQLVSIPIKDIGNGDGLNEPEPPSIVHDELSIFLHGVNLGHLYDKFTRNDYMFTNVFTMTEADMRKIGINADDARKLLQETEQFGAVAARPASNSDGYYDSSSDSEDELGSTGHMRVSRRPVTNISLSEQLQLMSGITKHLLFLETTLGYLKYNLERRPENLSLNRAGQEGIKEVIAAQSCNTQQSLVLMNQSLVDLRNSLESKYQSSMPSGKYSKVSKNQWKKRKILLVTSTTVLGFTIVAAFVYKKLQCSN